MVDCGGLENRCTLTGTVGSNPTASADSSSRNVRQFLNGHLAARVRPANNQDSKLIRPQWECIHFRYILLFVK